MSLLLSAAGSINKTAEAYSKVNSIIFSHLSNYHYLLTKIKILKFSKYMMLPYLGLLLWLIIFCKGCMCISKLPHKAPLFMGTKELTSQEVSQIFPPQQGLQSLSSKDTDTITPFITTLFLWRLQSSSNTLHTTLSEFGLEAIFL